MIPASDLWMLGLRPLRTLRAGRPAPTSGAAAPFREMGEIFPMSEPRAPRTRKYIVTPRLGDWRVTYDDATIGSFDNAADATGFACDVARLEAQTGVATIVIVQTTIKEMHCFTPPLGADDSPSREAELRPVRRDR